MSKSQTTPRSALDEIATSIKELILHLENREMEGRGLNALEIDTLAKQLQIHVETLLATSKGLREDKLDR
jgi:hypothetical protein